MALFDPVTGGFERQEVWQGQSVASTWSRGQAWAIRGFTDAFRESGRPELLDAAQRAADWYLARLPNDRVPSDRVPYWEFNAPDIPHAPRDASAAAIAASGLVELGRLTGGGRGAGYRRAAEEILSSLASSYLTVGTPTKPYSRIRWASYGKQRCRRRTRLRRLLPPRGKISRRHRQ